MSQDSAPQYDGFISYRHSTETPLVEALEKAVQKFAKPYDKIRSLSLYRDISNQNMTSDLFGAVLEAMDNSGFFILMASPGSKASKWVPREVQHWVETKSVHSLLIVLCDGNIEWDDENEDFDWDKTDCLPKQMSGLYKDSGPLYLDLREARSSEDLSLENPLFKEKVAMLSATLNRTSLENIYGQEAEQHRRYRRKAWQIGGFLSVLLIVVIILAIFTHIKGREARINLALTQWGNGVLYRDRFKQPMQAAQWFAKAVDSPANKIADAAQWFAKAIGSPTNNMADAARIAAIDAIQGIHLTDSVEHNETNSKGAHCSPESCDEGTVTGAVLNKAINFPNNETRFLSWSIDGTLTYFGVSAEGRFDPLISPSCTEPRKLCHDGKVKGAVFSPDGHFALTWGDDKRIRRWCIEDEKCRENPGVKSGEPIQLDEPIEHLVQNSLGTTIAVWGGNQELRLFSFNSAGRIWKRESDYGADGSKITGSVFNSDGTQLISWNTDTDSGIRIWCLKSCDSPSTGAWTSKSLDHKALGVRFSGDGKTMISWGEDGSVRLWNVADYKETFINLSDTTLRHDKVRSAQFSEDDSRILSWSNTGPPQVWDFSEGDSLFENQAADISVMGAQFNRDGTRFLSWGRDRIVRLRDITRDTEIFTSPQYPASIRGAFFNQDETLILAYDFSGLLQSWKIAQASPVPSFVDHERKLLDSIRLERIDDVPDSTINHVSRFWNEKYSSEMGSKLKSIGGEFQDASFTETGLLVLSSEEDLSSEEENTNLIIWYLKDAGSEQHSARISQLELQTDFDEFEKAKFFTETNTVMIQNTKSVILLSVPELSEAGKPSKADKSLEIDKYAQICHGKSEKGALLYIEGAQFYPDQNRLLTWGSEGILKLWDTGSTAVWNTSTGKTNCAEKSESALLVAFSNDCRGRQQSEDDPSDSGQTSTVKIEGATFYPHKNRVLGWGGGAVQLWHGMDKQAELCLSEHEGNVSGAILNLSGTSILSWGNSDSDLRLWDLSEEKWQIMKHEKGINGARFVTNETRILSWSDDRTVRLWDIDTGLQTINPIRHRRPVNGAFMVRFTDDMHRDWTKFLTWTDNDKSIRKLDVPSGLDTEKLVLHIRERTRVILNESGDLQLLPVDPSISVESDSAASDTW
jgi:WD40 repeat protein